MSRLLRYGGAILCTHACTRTNTLYLYNLPNSISLLPMPFALNCMMVNEFPSTACVGIGSGCSFGRVGGVLQELKTQSLIRLYSAAF